MDTWVWIVIVAAVAVLAIAVVAIFAMMQSRKRESERLRGDFGPEYDRTVGELGGTSKANRELKDRQDRVEKLRLRALSADERSSLQERWQSTQAHFVDEPTGAVADANRLVDEAMKARGYPVGESDFDQRAADISVDHPYVIENYRAARKIADSSERGDATTEQLRQGMVHYRQLFDELLNAQGEAPEREPVSTTADSGDRPPVDRGDGSEAERVSRTGTRTRRASS